MSNYVDEIMDKARSLMPDCPDDLLRLYCLLALSTGVSTTKEEVHDAWSLWRTQTRSDHPAIVPFDLLTDEIQDLDQPYVDAIRKIAKWL